MKMIHKPDILVRRLALASLTVAALILTACGSSAVTTEPARKAIDHSVSFRVMSWATYVDIKYSTPTGGSEVASIDASSGWTMTFHATTASGFRLSVANLPPGSSATWSNCAIKVDGKVVSSNWANGPDTQASCAS